MSSSLSTRNVLKKILLLCVFAMFFTSHGVSQTRPSLTLNVGICIETMYPLAAVNLSYPVYHDTVHLTGGFTFFNIGGEDPSSISEVNPFTVRSLKHVGYYRVYQLFIGSRIGKILFLQPKLSYNLFDKTSTVGIGVNAGVMFPSKIFSASVSPSDTMTL